MTPIADEPTPQQSAATPDAPQEVDLWWGGYSGRTMLPSFAFCVLLTAIIFAVATFSWGELGLSATVAHWLTYHLNIIVWLVQLLRWGGRLAAYEYRLTNRRLFCSWGFLFTSPLPIKLADIERVHVQQSPLQHWLDVGSIVVTAKGRPEPMVLLGVAHPQRVTNMIDQARATALAA
jgi:membrane protein YdbS with pleckstrin-like domain